MPSELKQRYAKRLLKFRSVPNKEYLKELVKDKQQKGRYISKFKESQLLKIEAIKHTFH